MQLFWVTTFVHTLKLRVTLDSRGGKLARMTPGGPFSLEQTNRSILTPLHWTAPG